MCVCFSFSFSILNRLFFISVFLFFFCLILKSTLYFIDFFLVILNIFIIYFIHFLLLLLLLQNNIIWLIWLRFYRNFSYCWGIGFLLQIKRKLRNWAAFVFKEKMVKSVSNLRICYFKKSLNPDTDSNATFQYI